MQAKEPDSPVLEKHTTPNTVKDLKSEDSLSTRLIKLAKFFKVQILWTGAAAELTTGIRYETALDQPHTPEPRVSRQVELQHQPGHRAP